MLEGDINMVKRIGESMVAWFKARSGAVSKRSFSVPVLACGLIALLFLSVPTVLLADDPPPPPPYPTKTSTVDQTVTNPATGSVTTVSELIKDPAGSSTAGTTAFVRTADGYVILVKAVGEQIYNNGTPPLEYTILDLDLATGKAKLQASTDGTSNIAWLDYQGTYANFQEQFGTLPPPPDVTPPVTISGADGVRMVNTGDGGSNGHDGALFVPPSSGGDGVTGSLLDYTNTMNITTGNKIGIEAGSVGGKGGNGGDSYLSFWSGRDGGNGGAGGTVKVKNAAGYQVATGDSDDVNAGENKYGIFAYSRSGAAGSGGSGFAAPGGGTGGHSSDGGSVSVENYGNVITYGRGAYGIYGLSVSNNGGNGGSQWGLVGKSGSGGYGGNGGSVSVTNGVTGSIYTAGEFAHGILAQSVGGSGGSSGTSGNIILSLQGQPDNGGNGGAVSVSNDGSIVTTGDYSRGIFAQSIGGGGGAGGTSAGLFALGGSGSNGGSSGTVNIGNGATGSITTRGIGSDGIFAQSVGGSGGSGSNSYGLVSVGGSGSKAGNGGAVTVENYGSIVTMGASARGIVAQSIGGGGGDGGSSGGMVSVGGSGSAGGTGAAVGVINGGNITTSGNDARGILAQSIGGGGGNGGSAGSVGVFAGVAVGGAAGGGNTGGAVNVTLQGKGDGTPSRILTAGDRATGVFVQSVGGGGGTGGGAVQVTGGFGGAASIAVGGQGGAGGTGGTVTLSKGTGGESNIQTGGSDAAGVMLQSVGGGGGTGGYALSVAVSGGPVSGSLSVAVGGNGGNGGAGGTVRAGSFAADGSMSDTGFNGNILTTGDRSAGFMAQSVGGGGGNGGLAVSAAGSGSLFLSGSIGIGIGGSGSGGGAGGAVSVATEGDITTLGNNSAGLLAQSVGGGGGNGGGSIAASLAASGGGAGTISVGVGGSAGQGSTGGQVRAATRSGSIATQGDHSTGILIQSVGGGGGNGGYSVAAGVAGAGAGAAAVTVGLGGKAGGGGSGGNVSADLQSDVETSGDYSTGVLVQSVGGGGGNGGFGIDAGGSGAGIGSGTVGVGLGGSGGAGGNGGTVQASLAAMVTSKGDYSHGFVAQSIGGGGGNGGFNVSAAGSGAGIGSGAVSVGLGGSGGIAGNGGEVTATKSNGAVLTEGDYSVGILAQSVGGGGGNGGFNVSAAGSGAGIGSGSVSVGLGGKGGSAGNGGAVSLTVGNDVTTWGMSSGAVIAQSVGGGGGNGGFNVNGSGSGAGIGSGAINFGLGGSGGGGGTGGAVTASMTGDITTMLDNSGGFLAQSIGGGGGNGGFNFTAGGSGAGIGSGAVNVGLGGSGGSGNRGGTVTATVTGDIITYGDYSDGFVAQSIGGGGGNGGFNINAGGSGAGIGSGTVGATIGGSGGEGGVGGDVTASLAGAIITDGDYSAGFVAQSIGGGGGNGGFSIDAGGSGAGIGSGAVSLGLGGSSGSGNHGGSVTATKTDGDVTTEGDYSVGILAQSVGGGGGNGGFNVSAAGSGAGIGSGSVSVGLGGKGGSAGNGGAVSLTVGNDVTTWGMSSGAVIAQSVGGGGGNGGFNVNGSGSGAGIGSGTINFGLGGSGGGGGTGGAVTASMTGDITTMLDNSGGFLAQSIGGGGGNGGFNFTAGGSGAGTGSGALSIGIGGSGGSGGTGGDVIASLAGEIATHGDTASGFVAQSIGGGGGNGGFNVSAAGSGAGTGSVAASLGLGGSGGSGNHGGSVTATKTDGDVTTDGDYSVGILAQSIGGGGGNGGFNAALAGSGAGTGSGSVSVGLGGGGGAAGNGGAVSLTVGNDVSTLGLHSTAVIAQSIGGGGGNGGFNIAAGGSGAGSYSGAINVGLGGSGGAGGSGAAVTASMTGDIETMLDYSGGFVAQSIGGGGGNGGFNIVGGGSGAGTGSGTVSVGLGGSGGSGGTGGDVIASLAGEIATHGDTASGFVAQSIGGGGGNGGFNVSAAGSGSGKYSGAVSVGLGGTGGSGNNAGVVTATKTDGPVTTDGDNSVGILAQSVGGGGGNGGFNVVAAGSGAETSSGSIGIGLGGFGGAAGYGNTVLLTVNNDVTTLGVNSAGVIAQSIGGGGGNGGFNVSASGSGAGKYSGSISAGLGGFGAGGSDGGKVTASVTGTVSTTGDKSAGVIAQSIGGGGGNGGLSVAGALNFTTEQGSTAGTITASVGGMGGAGGAAKEVSLTRSGYTETIGDDSAGLLAQSIGGGGGNGGLSVAGSIGGPDSKQVTASVGGMGGAGSEAGVVSVTNTGNISTGSFSVQEQQIAAVGTVMQEVPVYTGRNSDGILAQSIGGGGGNGGFSFSGAVGATGENTNLNVGLTVGGFGGSGGTGSDVFVDNTGVIQTLGSAANGISAQSIGGGGGNGGGAVTGLLAGGDSQKGKAVNVAVSVGGMGGDGNVSGKVRVDQEGGIVTRGAGSNGILAQSIAGGGGNGGAAHSISLQLGTTCTFDPLGVVTKGLKITSVKPPKNASINVQVDVGGFGGTGADAADVMVNNHGYIVTTGAAASGILAQSIGGGGGNGGQAIVGLDGLFPGAEYVDMATLVTSQAIGTTGFIQGAGRVTVGGFGGSAGDGDLVSVSSKGAILTSGVDSYGIFAQSVGGGGGIGGNAASGITGAVSIGGFGAASGNGGDVVVDNLYEDGAFISTTGYGSTAIVAQSVGGGGGNGGSAGGLIGVGGTGGASGVGGSVTVTNESVLRTTGDLADGILAQSVGGGGGVGGSNGLSVISVGGAGGAGGDGGDVRVANTGTSRIWTSGEKSNGVFAQSVGAGGGNGGSTSYGAVTVGGSGAGSGKGGLVSVTNNGVVVTEGDDAVGLFGQSVGGGGGNGGATKISLVSVGGKGGASSDGGEVMIKNAAAVATSGSGSDAVRAQSIGGGGGSAGGVFDESLNGVGLLVSVGGSGSSGGNGGNVTVDNSSVLVTSGELANGIFAQSVGGGGGYAGNMIGAIAVGGSQGGYGDGGEVFITNSAAGTIWTKGIIANGIFAQSIGGGGGNTNGTVTSGQSLAFHTFIGGDGSDGGNGGSVSVENAGMIQTDGASSQAILAQSIGGGGGNAQIAGTMDNSSSLASAEVIVGGNGGHGGNGGKVAVTNAESGTIVTNGANSTAIFAQSVGGGGGNGGGAIIGLDDASAATTSVTIGGNGGDGGDGGAVTVRNDGLIEINANNSLGIMAQSVGGGGGTAGSAMGSAVIPVSIGGQNGVVGTGGDVLVTNSGSIVIEGDNSVGIFAQSVGGGGGMLMPGGGATSIDLKSGGVGNGGSVEINNTAGSITVTGANSIALYSQSVGGGGGAVGLVSDPPGQIGAFLFSGTAKGTGTSDETTINQRGDLVATGLNSIALTAQSVARDGNGDITINIFNPEGSTSRVVGGSDQGAGVFILDGADNTLDSEGIITTVSGIEGYAVRATTGSDKIVNRNLMIGSVDLGEGSNALFNNENKWFKSGTTVYLGSGNLLTNDGYLTPGDWNRVLTTDITGNYLQSDTGIFCADLDLRYENADMLDITGTGYVSGTIPVNLVDPVTAAGYALAGDHSSVLMSAAMGMQHGEIELEAPNTAVANYWLDYPNATDIDLNYRIDYSPAGLTWNQHSVGYAINRIQTAQLSPDFRPIAAALFFQPDISTLGRIYDSLSGEGVISLQQADLYSTGMFHKTIASRTGQWVFDSALGQSESRERSGSIYSPASKEGNMWMTSYFGNGGNKGDYGIGSAESSSDGVCVTVGFDRQISEDAILGFSVGKGSMNLSVSERETDGDADFAHFGGYAALRGEQLYLRGSLSYGRFDNYVKRHASIPAVYMDTPDGKGIAVAGYDEQLYSRFEGEAVSGDIEFGFNHRHADAMLTPFAGLSFSVQQSEEFEERRFDNEASEIGLFFKDRQTISMPFRLGLQFATLKKLSEESSFAFSARGQWIHELRRDRRMEMSFISAPGFEFPIIAAQPDADVFRGEVNMSFVIDESLSFYGGLTGDSAGSDVKFSGLAGWRLSW